MPNKSKRYIAAIELFHTCNIFKQGRVKLRYDDENTSVWYYVNSAYLYRGEVVLRVRNSQTTFKVHPNQWLAVDWY